MLNAGSILPQGTIIRTLRTPCRCKTKLAVVPAHSHTLWAEALQNTPLAPAIVAQARFLGASLCSRSRIYEEPCHLWSRAALHDMGESSEIGPGQMQSGLSLELRADSWNTYCVSTVPYPAAISLPGPDQTDLLEDGVATLFPTGGWA